MKKIYKYYEGFGRMGSVTSVFTADQVDIDTLNELGEIPLGEILGKHSEVFAVINESTLKEISDDPVIVAFFDKHFSGVIGPDLVERAHEQQDNL